MGAQIKVKQIKGLQSTIDSILGIDNIVESFTTTAIDGDTGIVTSYMAKETDAIQIFINGQKLHEGYSWKKAGVIVTSDSLEVGTELVWSSSIIGYDLDATDEIQLQYDTLSSGNNTLAGNSGIKGTITGNLIPDTNEAYDLGSPDKKFKDIYMSGNTLYMGGQPLSIDNGQLTLNGNPVTGNPDTMNSTATGTGVNPYSDFWTMSSASLGVGFTESNISMSADESTVWEFTETEIKVYSWDSVNNTTSLITSSTLASLGLPDFSSSGHRATEAYPSYDGTSIYGIFNSNSPYEFKYIDLISGNLSVRSPYSMLPVNGPKPTLNKNLAIYYDNSFGWKAFRWDGANWNLENILSAPGLQQSGYDQMVGSDVRKSNNDVSVLALINATWTNQGSGDLEIVRYDGTNWNVEHTDTSVSDAALSPDGTMLCYYKSGNYITMTYSGGSWSNLNTLTSNNFSWGQLSISFDNDTLIANQKFYRLDGTSWVEVPTIVGESGENVILSGTSGVNNEAVIFSRAVNNRLINYLLSNQIFRIREIPSNLTNIATNIFFRNKTISWVDDEADFWSTYYEYNNGAALNPVSYTFQDNLLYGPGDKVMIYVADYSLVLYAYVLSNDTNTNTLEILLAEKDGITWISEDNYSVVFHSTFFIKKW
jgi:hypothetical protein